MSHMIEQFASGAAFVSARAPGWHRLGTTYADQDGLTAEQVLIDGKLAGWDVRKAGPVTVFDDVTGELVVSDQDHMILRTSPDTGMPQRLGMCGAIWKPVQNETHVEFLDALVDGGAGFDAAMSLHGGTNVVVTMKLPAGVLIGGVDPVGLYIAVINYHDGHGSFTVLVTPVRIVCANTQAMALRNFSRMLRMRHTKNAVPSIEEARRAIEMSYDYFDVLSAEAERMINQPITNGEFERIIAQVFPKGGDSKMAATMDANRTDLMMRLFTEADTQAAIRGTNWAAYQAIVEYVDYSLPVRGADDEASARAARSLLGANNTDKMKSQAFNLLRIPA
ncbi:MAG TPA: DUF932 domain-containing protein [Streptosporangiaceae bacterium]|nr:DUF932 domain-containing protein [Streptosporangiaceae bacterium]